MIYFFTNESTSSQFCCYAESEGEAWAKLSYAIQNKTDDWVFDLRLHLKKFYLVYADIKKAAISESKFNELYDLLTRIQAPGETFKILNQLRNTNSK